MSIEIRNISKQFGDFHALRNVSLDIASGELVALLGPSGCGKTTLFRHMTVFENVAFGLRVKPRAQRPDEATIKRKVHELLGLVQLDWLADRYPSQLSGGQRQRIALARALAVEPKVLLLDEPFGALDAKVRKELRRWLRRLHDELHVTSIFVTHDQEEALEVADRVVLMNQGRVEQVGSPQEVWDHPASPFVYGFLGDVNLFHGRAHEGEVRLGADHHGIRLQSPEHHAARDARAFAYVRPHDLDVQPYVQGAPGIAARLDRAIVVGPIARLELTRLDPLQAGDNAIIEAHLGAQEFRRLGLGDGDQVNVQLRNARVFVDAG
jgi:sulfate transport system ATP-binding protein